MTERVQSPEKVSSPPGVTPLVVLGMHRSGTSAITRAVNLLGVDLGTEEHMHRPRADNPTGFWENGDLVELNDELLSRHGGNWHEPPVLPPNWQLAPELEDCRQRARELIRAEFGPAACWGWKDPRACLTLPFWQQLLGPMSYIICLRNPMDVARSLHARDGFTTEKGLALWLRYTEAALVHTTGQRRLFLFYEDFMASRRRELHRLAAFLGPAAMALEDEANRVLDGFIKSDLQHHQSSLLGAIDQSALAFPAQALQVVLRLYTELTRKAGFHPTDSDSVLQRSIEQLSVRAANTQQVLFSQRGQLGDLSARLAEQQQQTQELAARVAGQERLIQAAAEQEQQVLRSAAERDQAIQEVTRLQTEIQHQQEMLQGHVRQARELAARIAEQERTLQTALDEKQRLANQNAEHERHITRLSAERSQLLDDSASLTATVQQMDAELKRAQVELELAHTELQWMQSSKFWKLRDGLMSFKWWLPKSRRFLISIESPADGQVVGTRFDMSGWCVSTGKMRIKSMRAKVGDKAFAGVYGLSRPDVARACMGVAPVRAAEKSGFRIPIELAPGQYEIQLEALDAGDKEHVVHSCAVRIG